MINLLRKYWSWRSLRKLTGLQRKLALSVRHQEQVARGLVEHGRSLRELEDNIQKDLIRFENMKLKYDDLLRECKAQLAVAEDYTIPALVASHKLIVERTEAEMAMHSIRKVLQNPDSREES